MHQILRTNYYLASWWPLDAGSFVFKNGSTEANESANIYTPKQTREQQQVNHAIAKMTARCAQYMGALKSFESPRKRPRLLFPKFVKCFGSDRY